jgi:hypothetical protein
MLVVLRLMARMYLPEFFKILAYWIQHTQLPHSTLGNERCKHFGFMDAHSMRLLEKLPAVFPTHCCDSELKRNCVPTGSLTLIVSNQKARRSTGPLMMAPQETKLDGEKFGKERLQQV